ncbi:hypothetical protein RJ639_001215, partial [Escallonia herrerae]
MGDRTFSYGMDDADDVFMQITKSIANCKVPDGDKWELLSPGNWYGRLVEPSLFTMLADWQREHIVKDILSRLK